MTLFFSQPTSREVGEIHVPVSCGRRQDDVIVSLFTAVCATTGTTYRFVGWGRFVIPTSNCCVLLYSKESLMDGQVRR